MNRKHVLLSLSTIALLGVFLAPSLVGAFHTGPRTWHVKSGFDLQTTQGAITAQVFIPRTLYINAGDTVIWTSHHTIEEPHTVSFSFGNVPHPDLFAPFGVDGNIIPLLPPALGEPLIVDQLGGGEPVTVAPNARVFGPVDEWGTWVNSGVLVPESGVDEFPGAATSWNYTFTEPGTYNYHCVFHHWMTGTIVVRG